MSDREFTQYSDKTIDLVKNAIKMERSWYDALLTRLNDALFKGGIIGCQFTPGHITGGYPLSKSRHFNTRADAYIEMNKVKRTIFILEYILKYSEENK